MILDTDFIIALREGNGEAKELAAEWEAKAHVASDEQPELGLADAVVAATGSVYNETVATDDRSDFGAVDGPDFEAVST